MRKQDRVAYLSVPSLEGTQILFCHHFAHMLTTITLFSPPTPPSAIPIKTANGLRAAPNSLLPPGAAVNTFSFFLFMCYSSTVKGRFHYL